MSRTTRAPKATAAAEQREQGQKERYLQAVRQVGTLTAGCKRARVSPHTVYAWREHSDAFVLLEHEARNTCADELEATAIRRAKRRSDILLMFMLKALRPEKFRERVDQQVSGTVAVRYTNDWRPTQDDAATVDATGGS